MAQLQINTGYIVLDIVDNGEIRGQFKFNPNDTGTLQRLMELQQHILEKENEWDAEAKRVNEEKDVYGGLEFINKTITYVEDELDRIYGEGTSKTLFGDAKTVDMIDQFLKGIIPYYTEKSKQKTSKYTSKYKK